MKKVKLLVLLCCAWFLASCGPKSPQELVQNYVEAVANGDNEAAEDMAPAGDVTYLEKWVDMWENGPQNIIKKESKLKILEIYEITSKKAMDEYEVNNLQVHVLQDYIDKIVSKGKPIPGAAEVNFNDANRYVVGWLVKTTIDAKTVDFFVEKGEKGYKINRVYSKGLFVLDLTSFKKKWNCEINIDDMSARNDYELLESAISSVEVLTEFKEFANAVDSADTTKICKYFPALKDYDGQYGFKGKPVVKEIRQSKYDRSHLVCNDSTEYSIIKGSESIKIIDSRNVISPQEQQGVITAMSEKPIARDDMMDIAYIQALKAQKQEIEYERERAAEKAALRAQGAGLISHSFSTNTDKNTKGIKFKVANLSTKSIKYVILTLVGYNRVDDPVWDYGNCLMRLRGIGPISPGSYGSYDFDNIWEQNPDIVDSYEIKLMTIVFENGGTKTIKYPSCIRSDWAEVLDY